ncbi:hypothetical protein MPAR168_00540 [Methylorubrum populi]|uniref:Uncharacterized protein n=1 Tax=Methylobacterium radiotolerans TaxID=31998 RepID=A0ABU7T8C2_9HYPH
MVLGAGSRWIRVGRRSTGGTVNILTKQPVARPFVEMGTLFGSFGTARTSPTSPVVHCGGL